MDWGDFWWGFIAFIIIIALFFGPQVGDFLERQQYNECLQSTDQPEVCGSSPYTEDD